MIHAYITGVAPTAPPPAYYLAPLTGLAAGVSEDSDGMDENFWKSGKSGNFGNLGNFGKMWNFVANKGRFIPGD